MRKAIVLFCFILLVGSVAPSEADDGASPSGKALTWKNLSKGNTVGGVISNAMTLETSPSPKDKEKLKAMEREVLAARIIEQAMKLVRSDVQFGYDTFVLVDPRRDFPNVSEKRIEEMEKKMAFSFGEQLPIYVNVPKFLLRVEDERESFVEEVRQGDYSTVAAILSTFLAHELVHPYGATELEALRVEEQQLDLIAERKLLSHDKVKHLRAKIRAEVQREERAVVSLNRP